jgi:hypothetical protein
MDWMITFSSRVDLREKNVPRPMARMAMGIAASMPCPTLRAR